MKKRKNKPQFVLDSYAILTYLKDEPGWQKVRNILWDAATKNLNIYLNVINLGEVYYIIYREHGAVKADQAITAIKLWPIKLVTVRANHALIAARIKAENKLSYADAYVVATALNRKATILTGDPEFKSVEDITMIDWLPRNK
ncbi:type II toxin-antitoxin system VapC family toxin [Candidatus Margulisiibacteriota bacterium]